MNFVSLPAIPISFNDTEFFVLQWLDTSTEIIQVEIMTKTKFKLSLRDIKDQMLTILNMILL